MGAGQRKLESFEGWGRGRRRGHGPGTVRNAGRFCGAAGRSGVRRQAGGGFGQEGAESDPGGLFLTRLVGGNVVKAEFKHLAPKVLEFSILLLRISSPHKGRPGTLLHVANIQLALRLVMLAGIYHCQVRNEIGVAPALDTLLP